MTVRFMNSHVSRFDKNGPEVCVCVTSHFTLTIVTYCLKSCTMVSFDESAGIELREAAFNVVASYGSVAVGAWSP
jgi:hypothetical protein